MSKDFPTVVNNLSAKPLTDFAPYITKLKLPEFKNLSPDTEIEFKFPLTVFIGQNGSGKSSVLHALYGAPEGFNVSSKWFSTTTDPIQEKPRSTFIYSYIDQGDESKDILYQRAPKGDDYWETRKPLKIYGMNPKKRFSPVKKDLVEIDFRSILSAFDKYFYFENPRSHTKQTYLRNRSGKLNKVFGNSSKVYQRNGVPHNEERVDLNDQALFWLNKILNKSYTKVYIVKHKFYRNWGYSVKFINDNLKYSEAFAGAGELAVTILVYKVLSAKEKSLILLDEPEVSLHPGAQEMLKLFLLNMIDSKGHQIVISTHSPSLTQGLPRSAVKVFVNDGVGKFRVYENVTPEKAFNTIGMSDLSRKTIFVEDVLAKVLVEESIREWDKTYLESLSIVPLHGEGNLLKSFLGSICEETLDNRFYILDGDMNGDYTLPELDDVPSSEMNKESISNHLSQLMKNAWVIRYPFKKVGEADEAVLGKHLLIWKSVQNKTLSFLPFDTPEESLWDDARARDYLSFNKVDDVEEVLDKISSEECFKKKFDLLCKACSCKEDISSSDILDFQKTMVKGWLKSQDCEDLTSCLKSML